MTPQGGKEALWKGLDGPIRSISGQPRRKRTSSAPTCASRLKRLILPTFKDRPLRAITRSELETWTIKLCREGALEPATINRCLDNMKVVLKEACLRGFIGADPAAGLERLAEHPHPRGILMPAEIRLLFGPDALETRWAGARPPFAAAFLGIAAGLRMGEVRALRIRDVQ